MGHVSVHRVMCVLPACFKRVRVQVIGHRFQGIGYRPGPCLIHAHGLSRPGVVFVQMHDLFSKAVQSALRPVPLLPAITLDNLRYDME